MIQIRDTCGRHGPHGGDLCYQQPGKSACAPVPVSIYLGDHVTRYLLGNENILLLSGDHDIQYANHGAPTDINFDLILLMP